MKIGVEKNQVALDKRTCLSDRKRIYDLSFPDVSCEVLLPSHVCLSSSSGDSPLGPWLVCEHCLPEASEDPGKLKGNLDPLLPLGELSATYCLGQST